MKELENLGFAKTENAGALISGIGTLVAVISTAIAVLVTFTDITFGGLGTKEMTTVLAVLLASAYVIYFSLEESGERKGEETEEFRTAFARHRELCAKLTPEMLPSLRSYLIEYTLEEAASRRRTLLMRAGFTEEDYDAYRSGKKLEWSARRVMRRAEKIEAAGISPGDLLSQGKPKNRGELYNPEPRARIKMLLNLLPTTVCMLVTVSVMLSLKESLGPAEIFEGLMKLSALPIIGARGYICGFNYAKDVRASWLETKSRLLVGFLDKSDNTGASGLTSAV